MNADPLAHPPGRSLRVQFEAVSLRRGNQVVIDAVDLELRERRVGVIGLNGSGKSTLVRLINGLAVPEAGRVLVDGLDTARQSAEIRRRVGFVFADPDAQIIMPTPAEDVAFSLRRSGLGPEAVRQRVTQVLAQFGLAERADAPAHLLSGGEKQLLAIASVLVTEPELVIFDEPSTLLDRRNAARISAVIRGLSPAVILVTHQLEQIADFDRVIVMHEGRIHADGAAAEAIAAYLRLADDPPAAGYGGAGL